MNQRIKMSRPTSQKDLDTLWSQLTFGRSQSARELTDKVMANSFRLRDAGEEYQIHGENEVDFHLQRRLDDMELWINELTKKSEEVTGKIDTLSISVTRIRNAIKSIPPILTVDETIFKYREDRVGVDLIEDEPQRELTSEMRLLRHQDQQLNYLLTECEEKIRLLRKLRFDLGKQLEDRKRAKAIDSLALSLNPHSTQVSRHQLSQPSKHHVENESEWELFSWKQRASAETLLRQCDNLTTIVESVLRTFCESVQNAVCQTNSAFEERLVALRNLKEKLVEEHNQISINIREMENVICRMQKTVVEKESSVALSETRLALRNQRPNFELVRDEVHKGLELELKTLRALIDVLLGQWNQSKLALKALLANQLCIEEEINTKLKSICIDETNVLPLRKTISIQPH